MDTKELSMEDELQKLLQGDPRRQEEEVADAVRKKKPALSEKGKAALELVKAGHSIAPYTYMTESGECSCMAYRRELAEKKGGEVSPCAHPGKHSAIKKLPKAAWTKAEIQKVKAYWFKNPDANIGLFTPGLLKVDIDNHPGKANGWDTMATLSDKHGRKWEETVRARSGSASDTDSPNHYLYRLPPEWVGKLKGDVDALGKGVDVLIHEPRGLVVEPSVHPSGGKYRWDKGHELVSAKTGKANPALADAPQWMLGMLKPAEKPQKRREAANGRDAGAVDMDRLVSAVEHLARAVVGDDWLTGEAGEKLVESSGKWNGVLAGIVQQTGGSEEGWEMLDKFSRGWEDDEAKWPPSYDREGNRALWDKEVGRIGRQTIDPSEPFRMARAEGWEDPVTVDDDEGLSEGVRKVRDDFIYLTNQHAFVEASAGGAKPVSPEALNTRFMKDYGVLNRDHNQDGKKITAVTDHRHNRKQKDCVDLTWSPCGKRFIEGKDGGTYLNTYTESMIKPDMGATLPTIQMYLDHCKFILGSDEQVDRFLDWAAFCLQKPTLKINWQWLIIGGQGTGKDMMLLPLTSGLGEHNVGHLDGDALTKEKNGAIAQKKLLIAQEVQTEHRGTKYQNSLKQYASSPPEMLTVDEKYQRPYQIPNVVQIVMMSNHHDAMHIENDDRRWNIVISTAKPKDAQYYTALYKWLKEEEGIEKVVGYLLNRDVSGFAYGGRAPCSESKQQLMDATLSDERVMVQELIDERKEPFVTDVVSISYIKEHFDLHSGPLSKVRQWGKLLRAMGCAQRSPNYKAGKNKSRKAHGWIVRNAEHWEDAPGLDYYYEIERAGEEKPEGMGAQRPPSPGGAADKKSSKPKSNVIDFDSIFEELTADVGGVL